MDPNPHVTGGGAAYLRERGLAVVTGVCEQRARRLNIFFNKFITTRRPFVVAKCAATLDGRIATRTGDSKWITGEAARTHVHRLRHAVDAIMVGIGTVAADNPSLTARIPDMATRDPVRIVLDSRLRIARDAVLLHLDSNADTLIICDDAVPENSRRRLESASVKVVGAPTENGRIDMDWLMGHLGRRRITSVLIEGGGRVTASALRDRLVDKCLFFFAPKILGGDDGVPICRGPGPELMAHCHRLSDIEVRRFGQDILIEGNVIRAP
jgi:diaminohydroxyphosphoribosylaminopyrimidine deaminase/5-amino-6-(5-phosphoribosylamino)uracil reductase